MTPEQFQKLSLMSPEELDALAEQAAGVSSAPNLEISSGTGTPGLGDFLQAESGNPSGVSLGAFINGQQGEQAPGGITPQQMATLPQKPQGGFAPVVAPRAASPVALQPHSVPQVAPFKRVPSFAQIIGG